MKKLYSFIVASLVIMVWAGTPSLAANVSNAAVVAQADSAPALISSYPVDSGTEAMWSFTKVVRFRISQDVSIARESGAEVQIALPRAIGGGFSVQATYPISDESMFYLNPADSSELWMNFSDYEFIDGKNYIITLGEGAVECNGMSNTECQTSFQLVSNSPKYTCVPASGTTLADLDELKYVTVTFASSGYRRMDFNEVIEGQRPAVTLTKIEGGAATRIGTYDVAILGFELILNLKGELPQDASPAATYQIVIPAGYVQLTDTDDFTRNSSTIFIEDLKCSATPVKWGEIADYLSLLLPSSAEIKGEDAAAISEK